MESRPTCPEGMVYVEDYHVCIDSYEASKGPDGREQSVKGARPWTRINWYEARDACLEVGKELCRDEVWYNICSRGGELEYPYGDEFIEGACRDNDHVGYFTTGDYENCEGGYPGIFDMSGNATEWIADPVDNYVARGGDTVRAGPCWDMWIGSLDNKWGDGGFRCCKNPDP
jgi:formylglycine-generating enzyme required for sulfatase activity